MIMFLYEVHADSLEPKNCLVKRSHYVKRSNNVF